MQLCFGCLHTFPTSSLQTMPFSEELTARFESVRTLVAKLQPTTSATRQCVAEIEEDLRALTRGVNAELSKKDQRIEQLSGQVKYLSEHDEMLRTALMQMNQSNSPRQVQKSTKKQMPMYASNRLQRFLQQSQMETTPSAVKAAQEAGTAIPYVLPKTPNISNRFGDVISQPTTPSGMKGRSVHPPPAKISDIIAAGLYCLVEAAAVRTQAAIGVLWLSKDNDVYSSSKRFMESGGSSMKVYRPSSTPGTAETDGDGASARDQDELLAPFIVSVGKHSPGDAVLRVSAATSLAGAVATTGVSVNIVSQVDDPSDQTLQQALTATNNHTLIVPVFKRYRMAKRRSFGVLQMIGGTGGQPFTEKDETELVAIASQLSYFISSYQTMISDWTTRTYNPAPLRKSSAYFAEMDQQPHLKGNTAADAFVLPPPLICRSNIQDATHKLSKHDILQCATSVTEIVDTMKDLHRYIGTLETSWRNAVSSQEQLEKQVLDLKRQLELTRQGLSEARKNVESSVKQHSSAAVGKKKDEEEGETQLGGRKIYNPTEIDELDDEVHNRMAKMLKEDLKDFFLTSSSGNQSVSPARSSKRKSMK